LEVSRRILGEEHPDTTLSAWNLLVTLLNMQETDAAMVVLREHLAWLVAAKQDHLAAVQVQIREMLTKMLNEQP